MAGSTPGPIKEVWAFISDEGDREGVLGGFEVPGIGAMPFITSSPVIREKMRETAALVARMTGRKIRLVTFIRITEEAL